jgi:hypothetical protein
MKKQIKNKKENFKIFNLKDLYKLILNQIFKITVVKVKFFISGFKI